MATETTNRDQLLDQWRELESAHARVRATLARALQQEHRLSLSEYEVLERLAESEGQKCRMQELSDDSELSQSALSRLVQRLEDVGYASRAMCDHDRRGVWAQITDSGLEAQKAAQPTYVSVLGETLGPGS